MKKIAILASLALFAFCLPNISAQTAPDPNQMGNTDGMGDAASPLVDAASPLVDAIMSGNTEEVSRLLAESTAALNTPIGEGEIADTASGESIPVGGALPLHIAIIKQNADMVRLLVDAGSDLYATDEDGWNSLFYAGAFGSVDIVRILLEKDPNLANAVRYDGATALHLTAMWNSTDVMAYLLDNTSLNINAADEDGFTPADFAYGHDSYDMLDFLRSRGGELAFFRDSYESDKMSDVETAVAQALSQKDMTALSAALGNQQSTIEMIFSAVSEDYTDGLAFLLSRYTGSLDETRTRIVPLFGRSLEVQDLTPVAYAAARRSMDSVKLLLEAGADPYLRDVEQWTALHFASVFGDSRIMDLMLGAAPYLVRVKAPGGKTALHLAAMTGREPVIRRLLAAGADPAVRDDEGKTPADIASENEYEAAASLLAAPAAPAQTDAAMNEPGASVNRN